MRGKLLQGRLCLVPCLNFCDANADTWSAFGS